MFKKVLTDELLSVQDTVSIGNKYQFIAHFKVDSFFSIAITSTLMKSVVKWLYVKDFVRYTPSARIKIYSHDKKIQKIIISNSSKKHFLNTFMTYFQPLKSCKTERRSIRLISLDSCFFFCFFLSERWGQVDGVTASFKICPYLGRHPSFLNCIPLRSKNNPRGGDRNRSGESCTSGTMNTLPD